MFTQSPPQLGNQFEDDRVLRSFLHRALPHDMRVQFEPQFIEMGALAGGELYREQLADRENEPRLLQWDAWGNRIDCIEVTAVWRRAERLAAEYGLVATAYERSYGGYSRVQQFALAYLFTASTDLYSCPLAMTDGAACALLASGNQTLISHAVPRLTSRDPRLFWTSGQWMTEATGGSDVGLSETTARLENGTWRLYGRKWFTSAIASQMALTLARPEGNAPGGKGLALFYVETRGAEGKLNGLTVTRLKDKLGTRKVPTAELELEGTAAQLVCGAADGIKNIAPMLNVTRTWNAVSGVSLMRRGLTLARDYARRRIAFGMPLSDKPLHLDTLAGLQAEFEAAFQLTFYLVELLGRSEANEASEQQITLLRILTPVTKLLTARQSVAVLSEVVESFGGAGYVEDTGLPLLLRDAHVLPIWEGTTNVLALDTLRALDGVRGIDALRIETGLLLQSVQHPDLVSIAARLERTLEDARAALAASLHGDMATLESGARRLALLLGRSFALALLCRHAQWSLTHENDTRSLAASRRFAAAGLEFPPQMSLDDARLLATEP